MATMDGRWRKFWGSTSNARRTQPCHAQPILKSESWFYEVAWREQKTCAEKKDDQYGLTADFIPAPVLLAGKARDELRELAISERLGIYAELIPKLEVLSAAFINRALFRMGWSPLIG